MHERDLIQSIAKKACRKHSALSLGIGDDCAIFKNIAGDDWLVSTDMLIEHVHFETAWHPPFLLGRKSLAVNISDIAAMGGKPHFALLSVGLPGGYDQSWTDSYMEGVFSILDEYGCVLIGGDTVSATELSISVTVIGSVNEGRAICRDGARPGDAVYVSGPLGSAAAGLHLYKGKYIAEPQTSWPALTSQHLDPQPKVHLASTLLNTGFVSSMQDISDGIATDLSHICTASEVAAVIHEEHLPAHPQLLEMCRQLNLNVSNFQLRGGEDYELLFTVQGGRAEQFEQVIAEQVEDPMYKIGEICTGRGVTMLTRSGRRISIDYQGYEHSS